MPASPSPTRGKIGSTRTGARVSGAGHWEKYCSRHHCSLARAWKLQGKDARHSRVKVACRFCRIAYQMVAGKKVFRHPGMKERHYILDKLTHFHHDHDTPAPELLRNLQAAIEQLPRPEYQ